jgi:hypothetical protein
MRSSITSSERLRTARSCSDRRLLRHAILDLGAAQVGPANIGIVGDGQVTSDPIGVVLSPSS